MNHVFTSQFTKAACPSYLAGDLGLAPGPFPGRTLHVVDAENLAGGPRCTAEQVREVRASYEEIAGVRPGDLVVVSSSHFAAPSVWFGWGGQARHVTRSGPDGADLALIEVIEREAVAERFDRVVIGSGDGIFSMPCAALQASGVEVAVVAATQRSLSAQLRLAARDIRVMEDAHVPSESAAVVEMLGGAA